MSSKKIKKQLKINECSKKHKKVIFKSIIRNTQINNTLQISFKDIQNKTQTLKLLQIITLRQKTTQKNIEKTNNKKYLEKDKKYE